jgi:hypothetical protein
MKTNYSFKILKYLYKELSLTDHLETEYAIQENEEWKREYNSLTRAINLLPKVSFYPKRAVLSNIISYSASTAA